MEQTALIIFAVTYVLLLAFPRIRAHVAVLAALLFIVLGIVPGSAALGFIDWNVILMISGTMGIVSMFIASGMPALLADLILEKTPTIRWAIVALSLFSGAISAFVDNVATVLIVAPIAITVAKKQNVTGDQRNCSVHRFKPTGGSHTSW